MLPVSDKSFKIHTHSKYMHTYASFVCRNILSPLWYTPFSTLLCSLNTRSQGARLECQLAWVWISALPHDVQKLTHTCSQKPIVSISSQLQVQYCHVGILKFRGSIYTTEIGRHQKWRLFLFGELAVKHSAACRQLCHLRPLWPQASHLISLSLSLFMSQMGININT